MNEIRVEVHHFVYRYLKFPLSNAVAASHNLTYYVLPFSLKYFLISLVMSFLLWIIWKYFVQLTDTWGFSYLIVTEF